MNRILFASALIAGLFCTTADAQTVVTCQGVNDTAAVQAVLDTGGTARLQGSHCNFNATIMQAQNGASIESGVANIYSTANPVFKLSGINNGIVSTARRTVIWGPGVGIELNGAISPVLDLLQINTGGTGLHAWWGAGGFFTRLHLNGAVNNGSYPLRIETWDTMFVSLMVSEAHDGGVRIGNASNIKLNDITLDRLHPQWGVGLQLESTGNISNIQALNFWMSQGSWPIVLHAPTGTVLSNVMMENTYATGFANTNVAIYGNVSIFKPGANMLLLGR